MVVKGIRYSETGGMACGPIAGPTFVEVMVYDKEGNSSFVLSSIMESDLQVVISDYPLFDIFVNAFIGNSANFDSEMEKADKLIKEQDDYDIYDVEEIGYGHYYPGLEKTVDLSIHILKRSCSEDIDVEDFSQTFIEEDLDDMDIPVEPFIEEEDEE